MQEVLDAPMTTEADPEEHFVIEAATKLFTFVWFVFALSIFAEIIYPLYIGIPTPARIPMIATTMSNSISVSPFFISTP